MGAAGSIDNGRVRDVEDVLEFDETSTLYISISSDTEKAFSKIAMAVKVSDDKSVLAIPVDQLLVNGYSWSHGVIASPEDDEKNINAQAIFSSEQKDSILKQCKRLGLMSRYTELYARPPIIASDSVFMNVRFEVRSPDNNIFFSELSGCILKSELETEADPSQDLDRGSWLSRAKELLPGERFEPYRLQFKDAWSKVEHIVEAASGLKATDSARSDFFDYSKKQSLAYQQLLEKGMTTPEGERLIREIEHLKRRCHQAAHTISSSVLGSMFGKGEAFVASTLSRNTLEAGLRLEELKKKLQLKFEHDIFSLAEYLSSREAEAWERLNSRFKSTDTSSVEKNLIQHEKEELTSRRIVSAPLAEVQEEEERGREDSNTRMRRQSSFGKRDDGRRRTLSPSRSFDRSDAKSPRPPVMRKRGMSPTPTDSSRSTSALQTPDTISETSTVPAPPITTTTPSMHRRNLRRSFTIQPVESFSSATAEVVEIITQSSVSQPGEGSTPKSASSLSALLNLTNAAAHVSKRRLVQRLALQKSQKSREQDAGFMLHSIFEFEFLLFELLVTEKMMDYMDKERETLQSKLMTSAIQETEELNLKHKKEAARALTENKSEEDISKMKTEQGEERIRLENKLAERKRAKLTAFEEARVVTMDKMAAKLEKIREHSVEATLSPAGVARIQNIFQIFSTLKNSDTKRS